MARSTAIFITLVLPVLVLACRPGARISTPEPPMPPPMPASGRAGLDIETISQGEAIRIADHLAPEKFTVFDYSAEWCAPCLLLTPKLEGLVKQHTNVALRKVDITDWESAAAKQATQDFSLPGLPYVRVYGPDGNFVGAVYGNRIEKIKALIRPEGRE